MKYTTTRDRQQVTTKFGAIAIHVDLCGGAGACHELIIKRMAASSTVGQIRSVYFFMQCSFEETAMAVDVCPIDYARHG